MKWVGACFVAVMVVACGSNAASLAADRDSVLAVAARYREAWLQGDTALALGVVSKDVHFMLNGAPDIRGEEGARDLFVHEMSTWRIPTLTINRQELTVAGDHAIDIGTYEETMVPKTGAPIHASGRYVIVWRREGGEWRLWRFILNDPKPASAL